MIIYSAKRIVRSLASLAAVTFIVFSLLRLMPVEGYFSNFDKLTQKQVEAGVEKMGLNKPVASQLIRYAKGVLHGDFGVSARYREGYPISSLLKEKMPISMAIGFSAMLLALCLGLPLGSAMARSAKSGGRFKLWDKLGSSFVALIEACPASVYYLFIQIYGTELLNKIMPLPFLFSKSDFHTWILPIMSLSLGNLAWYAMWARRYMIDESNKEYALVARAKGLKEKDIMGTHVFRNAIVPIMQYIPSSFVMTLVGSMYVESRYSIPGMGGLLVSAVKRQDNTLVQALVLIYAALSIGGILMGDIAMALADPRIRLSGKEAKLWN